MQEFASSKEDRSAQPLSPAEVKAITDKFDWNIFLGNLARIFHNQSSMCRSWLKAWQHLKRLALPSTPDLAHFNRVYAVSQGDFRNWCYTLLIALYDAGSQDASFHEACLAYIGEFFSVFPDEKKNDTSVLNFGITKAEALFALGRFGESEVFYHALVERLPDEGLIYTGWAEHYLWSLPMGMARGESILESALVRPDLKDRAKVLDRLMNFYDASGKKAKAKKIKRELGGLLQEQDPSLTLRKRR